MPSQIRVILRAFIATSLLLRNRFEKYLKRIVIGLGLLFISTILFSMTAVGAILSIFFALADKSGLVFPMLMASLISLLLAVVIVIEGLHMFGRRGRKKSE